MKPHKDDLRLEGAFSPIPPRLSDAVEAAFEKGERAMKKRHKIMTAAAAVAACAVLFAGAGLALGGLTAPKPDVTVTPPPPLVQGTAEATPDEDATVWTQDKAAFYHIDPECSGMKNAVQTTLKTAVAAGKTACPICASKYAEIDALLSQLPGITATPLPEITPTPLPAAQDKFSNS